MAESKSTATVVVTMTVSVHLTQPWGGDCTLAQVKLQAMREAEERLTIAMQNVRQVVIGKFHSMRVLLDEELLP